MDICFSFNSQTDQGKLQEDIERLKSITKSTNFSGILEDDEDDDDGYYDSSEVDGLREIDEDEEGTGVKIHDFIGQQCFADAKLFSGDSLQSSSGETLEPTFDEEQCLALNEKYTNALECLLGHVNLLLNLNQRNQTKLEEQISSNVAVPRSKRPYKKKLIRAMYAMPYFKDPSSMFSPPPNEDVSSMRDLNISHSLRFLSLSHPPWTENETGRLKEAVRMDRLTARLKPLMNRKELEYEKLLKVINKEERLEITNYIENLDLQIEKIRGETVTVDSYGKLSEVDTIDWLKISSADLKGMRTAQACKLLWQNVSHPKISKNKWTPAEDAALVQLVKEYQGTRWKEIAEHLGTNRSVFMCAQRYQTKLNPCLKTGKWTPEEDDFLKEVVQNYQVGDIIPWETVAYYVEGRNKEQCEDRWERLLTDYPKGCRWTVEEDQKLREAVNIFGTIWELVENYVPNRNKNQCRERWVNCLDGQLKFGNFSYEEDRILWLTVNEVGEGHWKAISKSVPGRSDNRCLQRYRVMKNWKKHWDMKMLSGKNYLELVSELGLSSAEDLEKIKADCEKGIFIPRPTSALPGFKYLKMQPRQVKLRRKQVRKIQTQNKAIFSEKSQMKTQMTTASISALPLKNITQNLNLSKANPVRKQEQRPGNLQVSTAAHKAKKTIFEYTHVEEKITALLHRCMFSEDVEKGELIGNCVSGIKTPNKEIEARTIQLMTRALNVNKAKFLPLENRISKASLPNGCDKTSSAVSSCGRLALRGQSAKDLYVMPALPPSACTLNGFRCLIENRATLLQTSGKFQIPGVTPNRTQTANENKEKIQDDNTSLDDEMLRGTGNSSIRANAKKTGSRKKQVNCVNKIYVKQIVTGKKESQRILSQIQATHDYRMMMSRFFALFQWPAFLSTVPVSEPDPVQVHHVEEEYDEQDEFVEEEPIDSEIEDDFEIKKRKKRKARSTKTLSRTLGSGKNKTNVNEAATSCTVNCSETGNQVLSGNQGSDGTRIVSRKRKREVKPVSDHQPARKSSRISELSELRRQREIQTSVMAASITAENSINLSLASLNEEDESHVENTYQIA